MGDLSFCVMPKIFGLGLFWFTLSYMDETRPIERSNLVSLRYVFLENVPAIPSPHGFVVIAVFRSLAQDLNVPLV